MGNGVNNRKKKRKKYKDKKSNKKRTGEGLRNIGVNSAWGSNKSA